MAINFRTSSELQSSINSHNNNDDNLDSVIHTPVIKSRFRSVLDQLVNNSASALPPVRDGSLLQSQNQSNDPIPRLSTFSFQNSRQTESTGTTSKRLTYNLNNRNTSSGHSSSKLSLSGKGTGNSRRKIIDEIKSNKFSQIEMLFRSKINKLNNSPTSSFTEQRARFSDETKLNLDNPGFTPFRTNRFSNSNLIQLTGDFTEVEDVDGDEDHVGSNVGDEADDEDDLKQGIDVYEDYLNQLEQPELVDDNDDDNDVDDVDNEKDINFNPNSSYATSSHILRRKEDERFQNKIDELNQTLEEQATIGRQVSSTLSEFYRNTWNSANLKMIEKNLLKYQPNIVEANKCLLVVAERQLLIQNEISMLQAKRIQHNYSSAKSLSLETCGKASLMIGNIRLKLNSNFVFLSQNKQNSIPSVLPVNGCFVLCLVEHESTLIESAILDIGQSSKFRNLSDHSIVSFLQFDVNMRFDDLNPDFEVIVKFFSMNHLASMNAANLNYSSLLKRTRYEVAALKFINSNVVQPLKKILGRKSSNSEQQQLLAADYNPVTMNFASRMNSQPEEPIATSFKLLGQFTINRFNCSLNKIPITRFDYSTPFVDKAYIDFELTRNYTPVKMEHSFWVQIENGIHPNAISLVNFNRNTFLHLNKSQFRANLSIDKRNFLICKSVAVQGSTSSSTLKNLKKQFNLASCINPCIEESILDDILLQTSAPTICLVFRQEDDNHKDVSNNQSADFLSKKSKQKLCVKFADGTKGGSRDSQEQLDSKQFKFLFISSNKVEELATLYRQISDRIRSVRIWKLSGNTSLNDSASGVGHLSVQQNDALHQQLYWSLINKFNFAN